MFVINQYTLFEGCKGYVDSYGISGDYQFHITNDNNIIRNCESYNYDAPSKGAHGYTFKTETGLCKGFL